MDRKKICRPGFLYVENLQARVLVRFPVRRKSAGESSTYRERNEKFDVCGTWIVG